MISKDPNDRLSQPDIEKYGQEAFLAISSILDMDKSQMYESQLNEYDIIYISGEAPRKKESTQLISFKMPHQFPDGNIGITEVLTKNDKYFEITHVALETEA